MVTVKALYQRAKQRLMQAGTDDAEWEATVLTAHLCGKKERELPAWFEHQVEERLVEQLEPLLMRRAEGYPLQYLVGSWDFMGLPFALNEDTLIPRADTETLVEAVLKRTEKNLPVRILDLCCGSGCIGISLAHFLPRARAELWDISPGAVRMSKQNAEQNGLKERCSAHVGDALAGVGDCRQYEIIVSNPPYLTGRDMEELQREVRYEPSLALYGGEDGLRFYRGLIGLYKSKLTERGLMAMECGIGQWQTVEELMRQAGLHGVCTERDLGGVPRVVLGNQ